MKFVILLAVFMTITAIITRPEHKENNFKEGLVWYFVAPAYAWISIVAWLADWDVRLYLGEDATAAYRREATDAK